jgi:LmbE family N-acetylglucosaminyl deacetylase
MAQKSALVIQAHPDDMEYHCGGTVAGLVADGYKVSTLIMTDGSKGTYDPAMTPSKLAAARKHEAENSAAVLGVSDIIRFDYPDAELPQDLELRRKTIEVLRRVRPDIVFMLDPWMRYEAHPDHRHSGMTALEAAVFANFPLFNPEQVAGGLEPHLVGEVWLYYTDQPNHFVDVAAYVDVKREAMLSHRSQIEMLGYMAKWSGTADKNLPDFDAGKEWVETGFTRNMTGYKAESGFDVAEAFRVCKAEAGHLEIG